MQLKQMVRRIRASWLARNALISAEWLFFGGRTVERILATLLRAHYSSRFRRNWVWSKEAPHFSDHRLGWFEVGFGNAKASPYSFYRGFYVSELLRESDRLLDIGCGDGFFAKRFFSKRCASIDAVDIEPEAIRQAGRFNAVSNISYWRSDAVREPFPREQYDVVVWDGAIGHFSGETSDVMLRKIAAVLPADGIFVGSESLHHEGHDHLQFFDSVQDMDRLFQKYFKCRAYKVLEYELGLGNDFVRHEAFWRCSNRPDRIRCADWSIYGETNP